MKKKTHLSGGTLYLTVVSSTTLETMTLSSSMNPGLTSRKSPIDAMKKRRTVSSRLRPLRVNVLMCLHSRRRKWCNSKTLKKVFCLQHHWHHPCLNQLNFQWIRPQRHRRRLLLLLLKHQHHRHLHLRIYRGSAVSPTGINQKEFRKAGITLSILFTVAQSSQRFP